MQTIPASPNEDVQKQILRELAFNRECRADFITRYYGAFLEDVGCYLVCTPAGVIAEETDPLV